MKKLVVFLVLFAQLGHACDCDDLKWVQKASLKSNKFMLLHFSNQFSYESDDFSGTPTINPIQLTEAIKPLMQDFLYVCANSRANAWAISKYQVTQFPLLLIVDGNGQVVYRFANPDDSQEFSAAILNFSFSAKFFKGEPQQFRDNPSYNTAVRLAQKYLDFSLMVDPTFKNSVYAISKGYLAAAEGLLTAKESSYAEKKQKLELFKLFHWAYEKNFALLDQELSAIHTDKILDGNANLFYFLKYITAKGLQQEEFSRIQAKALTIDGFEAFQKKADIILSDRA
jgi:hypothetical protein